MKLTLHKTVMRPILTYGSQAWTMTDYDEHLLRQFERKVLRKLYGLIGNVEGT